MNEVVQEPTVFTKTKAAQYLSIYHADIDWVPHIDELFRMIDKKSKSSEEATTRKRNHIAYCIIAPLDEPNLIKEPYHRLLFGCSSFSGFNDRDWSAELQQIWVQDARIEKQREELIKMGIIYPLEYVPVTRQALSWLLERSPEPDKAKAKMQNLVYAYGGAVICNIFLKPEYQTKINKILNWRTGYFFERLIHEVYKPEQLLKIKEHELNKVDQKLVKQIRINN